MRNFAKNPEEQLKLERKRTKNRNKARTNRMDDGLNDKLTIWMFDEN